jgi:hypothetical protein
MHSASHGRSRSAYFHPQQRWEYEPSCDVLRPDDGKRWRVRLTDPKTLVQGTAHHDIIRDTFIAIEVGGAILLLYAGITTGRGPRYSRKGVFASGDSLNLCRQG